jgi:hypothetical protein
MNRILSIAAAGALAVGVGSVASAAECVNGWMELPNQVILKCGGPPTGFETGVTAGEGFVEEPFVEEPVITGSVEAPATAAPVEEPMYTGSIEQPATTAIGVAPVNTLPLSAQRREEETFGMSASFEECQPGKYWMMENPNGSTPMACPGQF